MNFRGITARAFFSVLAALFIFAACKGPETTKRSPDTGEETAQTGEREESGTIDWDQYRSHLDDVYDTQTQDQPKVYEQAQRSSDSRKKDIYDGFRIQILSTRDVSRADTVSRQFKAWIDSTNINYKAHSYIIFKQPYYRVHVGDFNDRDKALDFSRMVKKQYPDAWIVYDRIKPENSPPDSLEIRQVKSMEKQLINQMKDRKPAADSTHQFEQNGGN